MRLSIVIPTRNRAGLLEQLVESLAKQDPVSFEWEVIIVDNASTDNTAETIGQLKASLAIPIRYFHEPRLGLVYGRHRGAQESRGEIVGFLDDDMYLSPTWVQGVDQIIRGQADAVVGRILPHWDTPPPPWILNAIKRGTLSYLGLLDLGTNVKKVAPAFVFGGNCFLPRKLIFTLGGFHPDGVPPDQLKYRGDGETGLMAKFKAAGLRSVYDPQATAYHVIGANRLAIEYFCSRAYNQGISDSYTHIRSDLSPFNLKSILKRIKYYHHRLTGNALQVKILCAYWSGYKFHQEEARADPELYRWIKKENYFT